MKLKATANFRLQNSKRERSKATSNGPDQSQPMAGRLEASPTLYRLNSKQMMKEPYRTRVTQNETGFILL